MESFDKQILKGATTTLILHLIKQRPMHGYEIAQTIKAKSKGIFDFSEGTIYPALYTLEEKGYISGVWEETNNGRRKKIYEITDLGSKALEARLNQWSLFQSGMNLALGDI